MTRTTRTALIILFTGSGLVAAGGMALVYAVPSYKMAAKEKWHRWKCPDVPSARSERVTATDGAAFYQEPSLLAGRFAAGDPNPYFGFDDPRSTFFTEEDGRGVLWLEGTSPAIVRDLADVSDSLVAIGAGLLFRSEDEDPDVRIVIRIDGPDGALVDWEQKRLRTDEHVPGRWEEFNFERVLHGLPIPPGGRASIFITSDGPIAIDDLRVVFRSARPLKRPT